MGVTMYKISFSTLSNYELYLYMAKTFFRSLSRPSTKTNHLLITHPEKYVFSKNAFLLKNVLFCKFCSTFPVYDMNNLTNSFFAKYTFAPERKDEILRIIKFLMSQGCTVDDIKEKCLLYLGSSQASYMKTVYIAELYPQISLLMPLMALSPNILQWASKRAREDNEIAGFPNRIDYLVHHLEISTSDLIHALLKHFSLMTMSFGRLDQKMALLKDAGIDSEFIVKDLWIFNYNETLLVTRITAARKAQIELKPWMLRCSKSYFESMLVKHLKRACILEGDDVVTYLAKKLECSEEYVEHMMENFQQLKSVNIPKIDKLLSFLYEKGYSPQEVRLFPRVFCSSLQTLETRLEEFRSIRNTLPTISQLCFSSKKFQSVLSKN